MADSKRSPAQAAAERLCEMSADARAAVVLDSGGGLAASAGADPERASQLAALTTELMEAVDAAAPDGKPEQMEAQVERGAVYLIRRSSWTLAAVARRSALPSLMFADVRAVLDELEAATG
jgi:predicted regulator of Ras-like GTPase activity (Roadblock/LC7/MglB family)